MKLNTKSFLNNQELIDCLNFLEKGRCLLVDSYRDVNSDRYLYSFRFFHSQVALDMVKDLMKHQWIDMQVRLVEKQYSEKQMSSTSFKTLIKYLQLLININSQNSGISKEIVKKKIDAIQSLLEYKNRMDSKFKSIEFEYYRDKVLFERELNKYIH